MKKRLVGRLLEQGEKGVLSIGWAVAMFKLDWFAVRVQLTTRAWSIAIDAGERNALGFNDVIYGRNGRVAVGHPRLSSNIGNGEVSSGDDIHANDCFYAVTQTTLGNHYSTYYNLIWQTEIYHIGGMFPGASNMADLN